MLMDDILKVILNQEEFNLNTILLVAYLIYNVWKLNIINNNISGENVRRCDVAIRNSFKVLECNIYFKTKEIILKNHVNENKEFIKYNIKKIIDDSYFKAYSDLTVYDVGNKSINVFMDNSWRDELYDIASLHVFNNTPTLEKLESLKRSLNTSIESYETHLINKSINKII